MRGAPLPWLEGGSAGCHRARPGAFFFLKTVIKQTQTDLLNYLPWSNENGTCSPHCEVQAQRVLPDSYWVVNHQGDCGIGDASL